MGIDQDTQVMSIHQDSIRVVAVARGRLQGYLAHKKLLPPRTLQKAYA